MPSFPDQFRDLAGFSVAGLQYSSPSDTAVKMYDALVHQAVFHYSNHQLGGWDGTVRRMKQADPEFAMGKIFTLGLDCFAAPPAQVKRPRRELEALRGRSDLTKLEKLHLEAALLLAAEDWRAAMLAFEEVLALFPLDTYALHMAYFLALTTGHTARLRDTPASVVQSYQPSNPFYGHVHGKLGFGQGEMGEYEEGEKNGEFALSVLPLDNWAHHALAHNYEESGRPGRGAALLERTEQDWKLGTAFSLHIWWHAALLQVQLGDHEAALSIYDRTVGSRARADGGSFPLSDASALLLRLQFAGLEVGDRARELARLWQDHSGEFVSLFYDGHNCFTQMMAGDRAASQKLLDNMREYIADQRTGWNKEVTSRVGVPLLQGITAFFDGEYDRAVELLQPVMQEALQKMQGSNAQKDIFSQVLLQACARSGQPRHLSAARAILGERLVERNTPHHTPVNHRFIQQMLSTHETS